MPQTITYGYKRMLDEAHAEIETISANAAMAIAHPDRTVLVDLRDVREREREGIVPASFHCPRGMLEFWIDPASPYAKPIFQEDKKFIFFCASGWRSALAAQTAGRMGLQPVAHIEGGFGAWKTAGGPVEELPPRTPAAPGSRDVGSNDGAPSSTSASS